MVFSICGNGPFCSGRHHAGNGRLPKTYHYANIRWCSFQLLRQGMTTDVDGNSRSAGLRPVCTTSAPRMSVASEANGIRPRYGDQFRASRRASNWKKLRRTWSEVVVKLHLSEKPKSPVSLHHRGSGDTAQPEASRRHFSGGAVAAGVTASGFFSQ